MRYFVSMSGVLAAFGAAVLLMTGCGSDDNPVGQNNPPPEPFSGSYRYVQMTGPIYNINDPFRSETGVFTTVGNESVRFERAYSANGGNSQGPIDPPDRSLERLDDRGVAFTDPGGFVMTGQYISDGGVAVLNNDAADGFVGTMVATKENPAPSQADLQGRWYLVQFGAAQAPAPATGMVGFAAAGSIDVDGAGAVSFVDYDYIKGNQLNPNFTFHPPSELVPDGDGGIMWRRTGMNLTEFVGGLSEDGNLILMGAIDGFGGQGGLRILVRGGLTTDVGQLSGVYFVGGFTLLNTPTPFGPYPMNGEMSLGGSGNGSWEVTFPPPASQGSQPVNYTVDSTGKVALTFSSIPVLWGWAGPQGDYFISVGPFVSGGAEPWFQATVR